MIKQGHIAESNPRTVGPFTEVIESYRKHSRRTAARRKDRTVGRTTDHADRVKAVIFYDKAVEQLEALNG